MSSDPLQAQSPAVRQFAPEWGSLEVYLKRVIQASHRGQSQARTAALCREFCVVTEAKENEVNADWVLH